ncbi:MAG: DNA repair protein RecO [Bacteroidetes bacterium]|nr:MAG: DNA repair protein RecO [Bacteroidota bacterium]
MIVNTEAIILKSLKYSDSSKILWLFTKDYGKISVIAKGARQTKSKFGAALEPLSVSNIFFYKKSNRELHTLSSAELITDFNNIQNSLESMVCGLMILESLIQSLDENETNNSLYEKLRLSLALLNSNNKNPFSIFSAFQIELAHQLGFSMKFDYHINSLNKFPKNLIFSLENGYIVDEENNKIKFFFRLDTELVRILKNIENTRIDELASIEIPTSLHKQLKDFFVSYFSFHLEKPFGYKTFRLLK